MRPLRSILWLVAVILGASLLLQGFGLDHEESFSETVAFASSNTLAVLRSPQEELALTTAGLYVQLAVRILGPIFLALAVLAVRGRVKR